MTGPAALEWWKQKRWRRLLFVAWLLICGLMAYVVESQDGHTRWLTVIIGFLWLTVPIMILQHRQSGKAEHTD